MGYIKMQDTKDGKNRRKFPRFEIPIQLPCPNWKASSASPRIRFWTKQHGGKYQFRRDKDSKPKNFSLGEILQIQLFLEDADLVEANVR